MSVTASFETVLPCLALIVLSGCFHVGPTYHAPKVWHPAHYIHGQVSAPVSAPYEGNIADHWWDLFHDPELTALEERMIHQNFSFRMATAKLAQSRAQLLMAGAERFPGLSASGSYQRSQFSRKLVQDALSRVGRTPGAGSGVAASTQPMNDIVIPAFDQWKDSIDATYEVDLWGRVAHQYEAAKADLDATEEERRGVLIAIQADLARDYLTLRGDQARLHILQENLQTLCRFQALTASRYHSGLTSGLDVDASSARVHETESQIAQLDQVLAQEENALALLLGEPPRSLHAELSARSTLVMPPNVPIGLPSELAHRRPDIREAEAKLQAAVAEVAEATADFYPKITINADFGLQSLSFRDLGFWSARVWNIGPSISLPIFQGGRLRGQLALKTYEQKAAAIHYQQTVIQAWHDVDNALTAYRGEQLRWQGLARSVTDNHHALDLAKSQYHSGLTPYLNVLDAQSQLQSVELALTDSARQMANNVARLYNALGGGWMNTLPENNPSPHDHEPVTKRF